MQLYEKKEENNVVWEECSQLEGFLAKIVYFFHSVFIFFLFFL